MNVGTLDALLRLRDEFTGKLKAATIQLEQSGKRFQQVGAGMSNVGSRLTQSVTLPLAALGGLSVKAASDFESSFAGVRKTVNATEAEFAALSQGMRDLSKTIPVNVNELNAIGEAAGQLGIKTGNILKFTETMAALGVATNLSSQEAATALARLANITQLPQDQIDRLGSTIVALGNNFATTEAEIVEMALRVAGAGTQIGLTEGQILAFSTSLSSVGIAAEAGGSAISKVMIDIALSVAQGGERLEQFADVAGVSSAEFARSFETDAAGAVTSFITGLGKMQEAGGNVLQILDDMGITEVRMRDALLRASGAGDLLTRALALQATAWEENNALSKEAAQRYQTFESQITILLNKVRDAAITFGTALLPVLRDLIVASKPVLGLLTGMADRFADLPKVTRLVVVALAGLAAAAGPVLFITGQLIIAWGTLIATAPKVVAAIRAVNVSLYLHAAAIAAVLLALNYLVSKWGEASEAAMTYERRASEALGISREIQNAGRQGGGIISPELFKKGATELGYLRDELDKTRDRIEQLRALQDKPRTWSVSNQKEIKKGEEALVDLTERFNILNTSLGRVGVAAVKTGKGIEDALTTSPVSSAVSAENQIRSLEEALIRLDKALSPLQAMRDMLTSLRAELAATELARTAQDLERIALAIELGISPTEAMTGRLRIYLQTILDTRRAIQDTTAALSDYTQEVENSATSRLALTGVDGESLTGEQIAELVGPINLNVDIDYDQLAADLKRFRNQKWEKEWDRMADAVVNAFGPAFDSISEGMGDVVNQAFQLVNILKSLKGQKGFAAFAGGASFGAGIGDLAKSFGVFQGQRGQGGFGGQLSGDYGDIGTTVGAAIGSLFGPIGTVVGAVLGGIIGGAIKSGADEGLAKLELVGEEVKTTIVSSNSSLSRVMGDVAKGVMDVIDGVLDVLSAELIGLPTIQFKVRDDVISVFVNGVTGRFKEMQEAIDFAVTQALRTSEIGGIGPAVRAALQEVGRGVQKDLDDLQKSLAIAFEIDNFGIPVAALEIGKALDAVKNRFDEFVDAAARWSLSLDTIVKIGRDFGAGWQAVRDSITGTTKSERQIFEERMKMFNQRLIAEKARLTLDRAAVASDLATAKLKAQFYSANHSINMGFLEGTKLFVKGMGHLLEATLAVIATLEAELAALDAALKALEDIKPIDIRDFRPSGGGRGLADQRKAEQDQLRDLLSASVRSLLPEFTRALAEINLKWDEAAKLAHGNAGLLAQINAQRQAEIEVLREQRMLDFSGSVREFVESAGLPLIATLADLDRQSQELMTDLGQVADELGLVGFDLLHFFSQIQHAAQTLRQQAISGAISGLLSGLAGLVSDEELRHELLMAQAQIEFSLRMAQFQAEFELLKAMGVLTAQQITIIGEALDFINQHAGDVIRDIAGIGQSGAGGGSGSGSGTGTINNPWYDRTYGSGAEKAAAALERLLEIQSRGLDPLTRAISAVKKEFDELRSVLGNTAQVQAAYAQEIRRVLMEQLEPIRRLQEELAFRSDSPVKSIDQFNAAQSQLRSTVAALRAGDFSKLQEIPDLARRVLDLIPSSGASQSRRDIFDWVNKILSDAQAAAAQAVSAQTGVPVGVPSASMLTAPAIANELSTRTLQTTIVTTPEQAARDAENVRVLRRIESHTRDTVSAVYAVGASGGVWNVS